MPRIHLGLSIWLLLFWLAETALGWAKGAVPVAALAADWSRWHQVGGLFVAVFTCLVHVIVMWHFLGSGKAMKEALAGREGDVARQVRRMKMKVYPWSTFAMLVPIAAAILGGAALSNYVPRQVHLAFSLAGLALNVVAVCVEQRWLHANARLLREVEAAIAMPRA